MKSGQSPEMEAFKAQVQDLGETLVDIRDFLNSLDRLNDANQKTMIKLLRDKATLSARKAGVDTEMTPEQRAKWEKLLEDIPKSNPES